MLNRLAVIFSSTAFSWLTPGHLMANLTLTASATKDCYIDLASPTTAFNTNELRVGDVAIGDHYHSLIEFDLSSLASTVTIRSATLTFTKFFTGEQIGAGVCHRLTRSDWTEAATWETYDGSNAWTTEGGDYDASMAVPFPWSIDAGTFTISGDDFVALVQDAITSRSGLLELLWNMPIAFGSFASSEHATVASRPSLVVAYTLLSTQIFDGSADDPLAADSGATDVTDGTFELDNPEAVLLTAYDPEDPE